MIRTICSGTFEGGPPEIEPGTFHLCVRFDPRPDPQTDEADESLAPAEAENGS